MTESWLEELGVEEGRIRFFKAGMTTGSSRAENPFNSNYVIGLETRCRIWLVA